MLSTAAPDGWKGSKAFDTADENSGHVVKFYGASKVASSIDINEVDRFIAALTAIGNSGSTINRKLAALSKMLKYAKQRSLITEKPHIARQKESEGRLRWLTREEEDKALAALLLAGHEDPTSPRSCSTPGHAWLRH